MTGDLHCHTRLSDGSTGIEDLISIARRRHIRCIAITDHDTMAGCVRAKRLGERYGIKVVHGAEFSAFDYKRSRKVHILCYRPQKPDRLEGLCKRTGQARKKASIEMIKKVVQLYPVTPEQIIKCASGSTNIYKQHISKALMDSGYSVSVFGELYDKLFSSKNGSCVVHVEYPDVFEVLAQIKEAGGIAVLAHPSTYDSFDVMEELVEHGLDGVEVWHPRNSQDDTQYLINFANENGLLMTGGSDFHGMNTVKPIPLATCVTPNENLIKLLEYKQAEVR